MVRAFSIVAALGVLLVAGLPMRALGSDMNLLMLQAVARIGVGLAAGNNCAAIELRPVIETTARYLGGAGSVDESDHTLINETLNLLAAATYDAVPCDQPCTAVPARAAGTGSEPFEPQATTRYLRAFDAVVSRWLATAESDPPTLRLAKSRNSYDPLAQFVPGESVDYEVHVGPACHGAILWLDRPYALPSAFEGQGSFVPPREGLWTIDLRRLDGLTVSPLTYLDAAGLPAYAKDFWVSAEPTARLGPGSLSPWHKRP